MPDEYLLPPKVKFSGLVKATKGADIASAAALTIGTDGNSFDVTGTTTIISINTVDVGTLIEFQFDAVLILTHDAADLILPTGANITTAAGDIAVFREYATGDWRCVGYTRADGTALATLAHASDHTDGTDDIPDATNSQKGLATAAQITLLESAEQTANKGANNGYASLDAGGKVPASQIPVEFLEFLGNWNASTNSPTLANSDTGKQGNTYRVDTAGTTDFGAGGITFAIGDWVYNTGSVWEKGVNTDVTHTGEVTGAGALTLDPTAVSNKTTVVGVSGMFALVVDGGVLKKVNLSDLLDGGVTDHGALTGLGDDDHSIYALLAGRSGGQTYQGGTASGNNLDLESTSNATKGLINVKDTANFQSLIAFANEENITLSATANNWNPTNLATTITYHVTASGAERDITGIVAPTINRIIVIGSHDATFAIRLLHEDSGSTAANRLRLPGAASITLQQYDHLTLLYSLAHSRWHVIGSSGT